jgi:hypothetical protein
MPDAVGIFSDAEDYGAAGFGSGAGSGGFGISQREGIVGVGAEPGMARVEASADGGVVVVQDEVFTIHPAGELGAGDFDLGVLVSGDAGVGDGDSPQHGGGEIRRLGGVDVSGFVADFVGDAGVGLGEAWDADEQDDLAELAHGSPREDLKILAAKNAKKS